MEQPKVSAQRAHRAPAPAEAEARSAGTDEADEQVSAPEGPRRLTDPASMRALSHPVRLALIEALSVQGPLTATQAGQLIGESPTTCSFHFRQLAKYGFVEEAGPMPGRSRPWRVTRLGWSMESDPEDGTSAGRERDLAARHLGDLALERQLERHRAHRQKSERTHTIWWVTPDEADELQSEIDKLVTRYRDRLQDPASRPTDAGPVEVVILTHPFA
ncbi:helix-turn-helix domain-containing protein [Streptomyces sp. A1277]|uniref:helix-turn-helix domain-containing protein n=1 Tax=Streptomyces sp. A1277 TaxID=2563103 RepID=UPI0014462F3A|nr:helix-turn-helix domain-containing protein [Streptomyces sp. A1277]